MNSAKMVLQQGGGGAGDARVYFDAAGQLDVAVDFFLGAAHLQVIALSIQSHIW